MPIRPLDTEKIVSELTHYGFCSVGEYGFNFKTPLRQNLSFFIEGQPYRLAEGRLLVVHQGSIDLELDLEKHHLEAGDIALAMPDSLAIGNSIGIDSVVSIVTFHCMPKIEGRQECLVVHCDEETLSRIEKYIDMITLQMKRKGNQNNIVSHLVEALIMDVQSLRSETTPNRVDSFMHRFLHLLSQEGRVKHPIVFYAERLCVTSGYVSTMVKRHSGMTALQWIDRALVREAKILLRHTQMPVAEVAETLGFSTPSFFIRFFRQQTGLTPLQFRKKQ
ncbi:MAG: AraC family transcriptional regulator [Bacteroidales bacterium]|nr:AraC family transcriptional regulator [Bacteroidales bacterium]